MGTPFENFVNLELPRRPALLTFEITAYTGDPNDVGAPSILQVAPKGTYYLRDTDSALWRKRTPVATSWIEVGGSGTSSSGVSTFNGVCLATDAVGDFMYVSGTAKNVAKVDITQYSKVPAVGCIINKPTTTTCVIQTSGIVEGIYTGFTPGKICVAGMNARPTSTAPTASVGGSLFIQTLGVALDTNALLVSPNVLLTKVKG